MSSMINQQQFFETRSVLGQQQVVSNYLYELYDRVKKGRDATDIWEKIFDNISMKTRLTKDDQQKIHQIFTSIVKSPLRKDHIEDFMRQVKRSTLKRPRVTKYFLRQLFPIENFSGSVHKYTGVPILQNVLDYFRYLMFAPPSKKFQQQMARYVYLPPNLSSQQQTSSQHQQTLSQQQTPNNMTDYLNLYLSLRKMEDHEKRKKIFKRTQKLLTDKIKKALSEKQIVSSDEQAILLNNLTFIFRVLEDGLRDRPSTIRLQLKPMSSSIYSIFQLLGWSTTQISNFFQTKSKNVSSSRSERVSEREHFRNSNHR